jgi:hypothetical protein
MCHTRQYLKSQTSARPPKENPPTTAHKAGSEGLITSNLAGPVLKSFEAGRSESLIPVCESLDSWKT